MTEFTRTDGLETITNFINSVLIIDDKALSGSQSESSTMPNLEGFRDISPGDERLESVQRVSKETTTETEQSELFSKTRDIPEKDSNTIHSFNLNLIAETLAEKGILPAVLPIASENTTKGRLVRHSISLAYKADITILDWKLYSDEDTGETAMQILEGILEDSRTVSGDKKKLIVIYSAEFQQSIKEKILVNEKIFQSDDHEYKLTSGAVRIVLFAKESLTGAENKVVEEEDLIEEILIAFAKEVKGIAPQAMISALTTVRDNTDLLLTRYSSKLDQPLALHHGITGEGGDLLTEMIAGEFDSLIDRGDPGANQTDKLNEICKSWISQIDNFDPSKDNKVNRLKKMADLDPELHNSFSHIKNIEMDRDDVPHLQLGVILKCLDSGLLYLCLEPRCDCLRLERRRPFTLIKLNNSNNTNRGIARFAINLGEDALRDVFIKSNLTHEFIYPEFSPDPNLKLVKAVNRKFTSNSKNEYQYIGMIKALYAQRIAQRVFSEKARVEINEYEPFRLK